MEPNTIQAYGTDLVLSGIFLTILWRVFEYFKSVVKKMTEQIEKKDIQLSEVNKVVLTSLNENTKVNTKVYDTLKSNQKLLNTLSKQLYDVVEMRARRED